MESLLITGASGLIGKELVKLVQDEYQCWIIGRKKSNFPHFIFQDLGKTFDMDRFPKHVDYIVHLAQADNHNDFPNNSLQIFDANIRATIQLLEYARLAKIKMFILASSGGIYNSRQIPAKESEGVSTVSDNQLNFYQNTKLCMEILINNYKKYFDVIVIRPFFVYGRGQKANMLIPRLADDVLNNKVIEIGSLSDIQLNPIHCSDAAHCFYNALKLEKSDVYNIAGNQSVKISEIVKIIGSFYSKEPMIKYLNKNQQDLLADNTKMVRELWNPRIDIREGIEDMLVQG